MKSSKLLLTSLLAAAAMGASAFAETTTGTLLPTLGSSGTGVTYLTSTNKTADWQQGLGSSNISASVVANDLSVCSKLAEDGWHFSVDNKSTEDKSSDSSFTATGFTFTGRSAYGGEFVAATVDLNTLLGTDKKMTDISISFTGNVQTSSYFSVWSWDGTTATQIAKQQITTTAYSPTTENANVTFSASDLILTGTEKFFVVWSDNSAGSSNTISNLTSSYTASTFSTLYWRGNAKDETWSSSSTQWNATSSETAGNVAATSLDDVIFDSSATVEIDPAGVAVDTLTISAGTVSFTGGKVTAKSGFTVDNGGTLTLSSNGNLFGDVTVNAGGTFDLNGKADSVCYSESDSNRLGTVYLNGGVLKDSVGSGIGRQLSKIVLSADSTVTAVAGSFGLVGAGYAATELDLGGHTLTKDGAGTFLITTTTIKNGTLSVTEGTISDHASGAVTLGANAVIDVKENGGVDYLTIASMAAGSALKLAGTTANTVTLGVSAGNDRQISGNLTIGNATVTTAKNDIFNYDTTVERTLELNSGGELAIASTRQSFNTNWKITLNGGKISGIGDGKGYALDFFQSNTVTVTADSEISANLCMREVNTNTNTLAFNVNADKTLTVSGNIVTPASGAGSNAVLVKQGSGTLVLSGANTYNKGTRIEAGTVEVQSATGLGASAGAVTVTGDATLQIGETNDRAALSVGNNIAVDSGKTLTLKSENTGNTLSGVISGAGAVKATYYFYTDEALTLAGDNSFSGGLEVVGVKVSAGHANALGSGMVKIADTSVTYEEWGYTATFSSSVNAAAAGVVLHDVSLLANNSAQLTADASCNFTVASGATLYLDIGALGAGVLTGDKVALTIAAQNALDNSFFSTVEVGTYVDDVWRISSEWKYLEWSASAGTLSITAIPEPSVFGLLAGLGALALAGTRRRRRKA